MVDDFGMMPSAVIDSGHGLYAWWFFTSPLVLTTGTDRTDARALSTRVGATLVELGRAAACTSTTCRTWRASCACRER